MSKIFVSIQSIESFISKNIAFTDRINLLDSQMTTALGALLKDANDKQSHYEALLSRLEGLRSRAQANVNRAAEAVAKANAAAASVPKTVTKTTKTKDGKEEKKEVPNPEYGAAQSAAAHAREELARQKKVLAQVDAVYTDIKKKLNAVSEMAFRLRKLQSSQYTQVSAVRNGSERATQSAQRAKNAVKEYLSVRIN